MYSNVDFLDKELVNVYSYSDKGDDRSMEKYHTYNGRHFIELGEYTVSAYVAKIYKVTEKDSGMVVYITNVGMARQHPNDYVLNMDEAWELASERAEVDPIMSFKTYTVPGQNEILKILKVHNSTNIMTMVRTKKEVEVRA